MKTTSISHLALTVVVALFTAVQEIDAVAASGNKTEMVKHNNQWMPVCHLPVVAVTATADQLVEVKEVNGTVMPVVHLQEVTVNASGKYSPADVHPVAILPVKPQGYRVEARKINDVYMPVSDLPLVTVEATSAGQDQVTAEQPVSGDSHANKVFTISARKSFDTVVNLMVQKAMDFMHTFLNSSR